MEHVQATLKRKDIQDLISVRIQGGLTGNVVPVSGFEHMIYIYPIRFGNLDVTNSRHFDLWLQIPGDWQDGQVGLCKERSAPGNALVSEEDCRSLG
jgi:hypothetical protein